MFREKTAESQRKKGLGNEGGYPFRSRLATIIEEAFRIASEAGGKLKN